MQKQIANTLTLVTKKKKKNFGIPLVIKMNAEDIYKIDIPEIKVSSINKAFFNMLNIKENDLNILLEQKIKISSKDGKVNIIGLEDNTYLDLIVNIARVITNWILTLESNMNMIITGLNNCPIETYPIYRGTSIILGIQEKLKDENLINDFTHFILPKVDNKKSLIIRNIKISDIGDVDKKSEQESLLNPNEMEICYFADKFREELYVKHIIKDLYEEIPLYITEDNGSIRNRSKLEIIQDVYSTIIKFKATMV